MALSKQFMFRAFPSPQLNGVGEKAPLPTLGIDDGFPSKTATKPDFPDHGTRTQHPRTEPTRGTAMRHARATAALSERLRA